MKRQVVWTEPALTDYDAIISYVATDNPFAAGNIAARIAEAAVNLGDWPTGRPGRVKGTYEKVLADLPYILAYEVETHRDLGERILILRVIHGARDWQQGTWPKR